MKFLAKKINILLIITSFLNILFFLLLGYYSGLFSSFESLMTRELSFVISPYANDVEKAIILFVLYIISLITFSLLIKAKLNSVYVNLGSLFILLASFMAILLIWVPMDLPNSIMTDTGRNHIMVGVIMTFLIMLSMLCYSLAFKHKNMNWIYLYTKYVTIIIALSAILVAHLAFINKSTYVGVVEKLPITMFLLWIPFTTLALIKNS